MRRFVGVNDWILIFSGLFLLLGINIVFLTGSFSVWVFAKMLYLIGVVMIVFRKE